MKKQSVLLIAILAFAIGFLTHMYLQKRPDDTASIEPIENAQELVSNFSGFNKYYSLSDQTFEFLNQLKNTSPAGDGFVVYYGTDVPGDLSNALIGARIDANKTVMSPYYFRQTEKTGGDNCPKMCDIQNGLTIPDSPIVPMPSSDTP